MTEACVARVSGVIENLTGLVNSKESTARQLQDTFERLKLELVFLEESDKQYLQIIESTQSGIDSMKNEKAEKERVSDCYLSDGLRG